MSYTTLSGLPENTGGFPFDLPVAHLFFLKIDYNMGKVGQ
jgi:hypothetical protein